ncbi:hypothetical protein ACSNOI_31520 [Actinomadura kijaniata]
MEARPVPAGPRIVPIRRRLHDLPRAVIRDAPELREGVVLGRITAK